MKQNKNEFSKYLNIPLSIINQKWFGSDKAVRAWFFMARKALSKQTKNIKSKDFHLSQGEMICTRSYLSEKLGINDSSAKSCTDRLKRSGAINVRQELVSGSKSVTWNKVSRITVKGVPVPNESYVKMYFPVAEELFWEEPVLAQLYTYMICTAFYEDSYIIGTKNKAKKVSCGDVLLSYKKVLKCLKCKEWKLKRILCILESAGSITRMERVGNRGVLIHLNYYPEQHAKKKLKNKEVVGPQQSQPSYTHSASSENISVEKKKKKSYNSDKKQNVAILDTDVTEAISYLFFEKKKNKDIVHLNQVIEYVNNNMPANFPKEKLMGAMDYYFSKYGHLYVEGKYVVEAMIEFQKSLVKSSSNSKDKVSKIQELRRKMAEETENYNSYDANWKIVGENFKRYMEEKDWISTVEPGTIDSMYHTLWYANLKGKFVAAELLVKGICVNRPSSWNEEIHKWANYIERFFDCVGNIRELRRICEASLKCRQKECNSQYTKYNDELERLIKKAI